MAAPSGWLISILGITLVLAGVATWQLVLAYRSRAALSPELKAELAGMPMAAIQVRAWWSLLIGVAAVAAIAALIGTTGGPARFWIDDDIRLVGTGAFILALVAHFVVLYLPLQRLRRDGGLDERDRRIVDRAPAVQSLLIVLTIVAWAIGLAERFHDAGAVPLVFLNLITGSAILAHAIGMSAGILVGYRRSAVDGQS